MPIGISVKKWYKTVNFQLNNWKGEFLNKYETVKSLPELKKQYSFLKEVDSIALAEISRKS